MLIELLQTLAVLIFVWCILKVFLYKFFFRDLLQAAMERDPAARGSLMVIFTYSGARAVAYHRVASLLHRWGLTFPARFVSQWARWLTGIEIHPGAAIGKGLFIDHGMGVVIGETAVIGDNVTLFQGVTLGGTGKEKGKRHPTLGNDVVVGAGAKVLGNITLGDQVSVGANAVVLNDVPANCTVVGVPGRVARREGKKVSSGANIDYCHLPDPLAQAMERIQKEIETIERELKDFEDQGKK
jgi:serine O-acetyltransferase